MFTFNSRDSLMAEQPEKDNEYRNRCGVVCKKVGSLLEPKSNVETHQVRFPLLALNQLKTEDGIPPVVKTTGILPNEL